jgi:hypothetical protein
VLAIQLGLEQFPRPREEGVGHSLNKLFCGHPRRDLPEEGEAAERIVRCGQLAYGLMAVTTFQEAVHDLQHLSKVKQQGPALECIIHLLIYLHVRHPTILARWLRNVRGAAFSADASGKGREIA